jgi:hypothetical protein
MSEKFQNVSEVMNYFSAEQEIQDKFSDRLKGRYPRLFPKDENGNLRDPDCGIWCPIGWQPMVEELCSKIHARVIECDIVFEIAQIKEKFGGLRFYYDFNDERDETIADWIAEAERLSFKICEKSGAEGSMHIKGKGYGWMKTLSAEEAEKMGYVKANIDND